MNSPFFPIEEEKGKKIHHRQLRERSGRLLFFSHPLNCERFVFFPKSTIESFRFHHFGFFQSNKKLLKKITLERDSVRPQPLIERVPLDSKSYLFTSAVVSLSLFLSAQHAESTSFIKIFFLGIFFQKLNFADETPSMPSVINNP